MFETPYTVSTDSQSIHADQALQLGACLVMSVLVSDALHYSGLSDHMQMDAYVGSARAE